MAVAYVLKKRKENRALKALDFDQSIVKGEASVPRRKTEGLLKEAIPMGRWTPWN
jgi:hypothetical protein